MMNKFEVNKLIDEYIERIASSNMVNSFYPIAISKALGIPLTPAIERLNRLVDDGILLLKYEIRCSDDSNIIAVTDDYSRYIGDDQYCRFCDDDIHIDMNNVAPIYYFTKEYSEYVKKKVLKTIKLHSNQEAYSQTLMMV